MANLRRLIYLKIARRLSKNSGPVPGIISEGTKIKGNVTSSGTIHIDGRLEGDINCEELIIGVKGNVTGRVNANNLMLYGTLQGTADVNELFIAKSAKLLGDALHNMIAVEPGAYIDGRCMRKGGSMRAAEQTEASLHREPVMPRELRLS